MSRLFLKGFSLRIFGAAGAAMEDAALYIGVRLETIGLLVPSIHLRAPSK
jgi:hypothetical protein